MTGRGNIDCGQGVSLERGVPCTMSDGTVLYADHYYPPMTGSHPTLLMRQPYGRDIASTVVYAHPIWFARQGYNVVIQDVRGRGDSAGEFYPFRHEGRDGAETIAFIRSRPEANGRVGMYGFSYQGITQLLAAAENPDGLCCIAPAMTSHDLYHGWFYNNGALRLAATLGWGLQMLKEDARRRGLRELSDDLERAWSSLPAQYLVTPYAAHPAIQAADVSRFVVDWIEHDRPGEYWSSMDTSDSLKRIRVPALHLSGWFDTYLKGTIDCFKAMLSEAASEDAREHQYLLAGPWIHIPWGNRIGTHHFGRQADFDTDSLLLRWFNHWLKGTNEFSHEPRIRHFSLNDNCWHSADSWPSASNFALYLHSEGNANSSRGDGQLLAALPTADEPPDAFVYDPEVPVIAPGGLAAMAGPWDQSVLELANNVLVYTTDPLEESLHVFGSPKVSIYCATSAGAADIVVKLICVRPSGEAMFICIGIARSQFLFRNKYLADTPQHWQFDLEPTSCIFKRGDRLRIELASSAYPLYDRNPGNDVAPRLADSWNWRRSTQIIFHDKTRPSSLHLPCDRSPKGPA